MYLSKLPKYKLRKRLSSFRLLKNVFTVKRGGVS